MIGKRSSVPVFKQKYSGAFDRKFSKWFRT